MAIFSSLAYKEITSQTLKDDFGEDLHPKILELAMHILNDKFATSNSRCIAIL